MKIIIEDIGVHLNNNALEKLEKRGVIIMYRGNKTDLKIGSGVENQESALRILKEIYNIIFE